MLKKIGLLFIVIALALLFAYPFGALYYRIFNPPTGFSSFIASSSWYKFTDGLTFSYVFFLTLIFVAFGKEKKYVWLGVLFTLAILIELLLNLVLSLIICLILGLLGWGLGLGVEKGLKMISKK